jgi:hypothetical protein
MKKDYLSLMLAGVRYFSVAWESETELISSFILFSRLFAPDETAPLFKYAFLIPYFSS